MSTFIKITLLVPVIYLASGCSPSTTVTKIYLQDVQISGPINLSPLHISDSSDSYITVSPKLSYNPYKKFKANVEGHSLVNKDGIFQMDTIFMEDNYFYFRETPHANFLTYTDQNMTWNMPEVAASLDIDLRLSNSSAFFFGVNYTSDNNDRILGGNAGVGLFSAGQNAAFRLDFGLTLQEILYDATTLMTVETSGGSGTSGHAVIYRDHDKSTNVNPFISFNYNTVKKNWPLNIFVNGGYSLQSVLNFEPKTTVERNPFYYEDVTITEDARQKTTASFIYLTPGLFFYTGKGRILIGTRLVHTTQLNYLGKDFFILPVLQFDFPF